MSITRLPLSHLVTERGHAKHVKSLGEFEIRQLLRQGSVRFVVAEIGHELRWHPEDACFQVWKAQVQPHLARPDAPNYLETFPEQYAYFASLWDDGGTPIIVLSKAH